MKWFKEPYSKRSFFPSMYSLNLSHRKAWKVLLAITSAWHECNLEMVGIKKISFLGTHLVPLPNEAIWKLSWMKVDLYLLVLIWMRWWQWGIIFHFIPWHWVDQITQTVSVEYLLIINCSYIINPLLCWPFSFWSGWMSLPSP